MKMKVLAVTAATFGLVAMPLMSMAAQDVMIESNVNVANVTAGDTNYVKSVNAKTDEVVKISLYLHNKELPSSGKVANNVKAKITLPTAAGQNQTISSVVSGDNTNVVSDSANINLALAGSTLEYIPGTAQWKHNVGTNDAVNYRTDAVSDSVVTTGVNLGNQNACYNFESYLTIQVRVKTPVLGITKTVKVDGSTDKYVAENSAKPGDTLAYAIVVKNYGNTVLNGVAIGDNLPPYLQYVPGSTKLVNSNTGVAGKMLVDGITSGGVNVDALAPGVSQTVYLKAKVATSIPAGPHPLKNVAVVKATGVTEVYNVATTNVNVAATPTPVPTTTPKPTVTPTPTTTPVPVTTTTLPETGAGAIAGMAGLGSVAYAGRAYLRSKKSLIDALRK